MKYIGRNFFLGALLLAMAGLPLLAQSNFAPAATAIVPASSTDSDGSPDSVLTIKARVSEVNVLFIAADRHGKFVRNLNQDDFTILDDHKPPQSIVAFRRETDLPLELGLLVDTSGSVRGAFDFEQAAAASMCSKPCVPASIKLSSWGSPATARFRRTLPTTCSCWKLASNPCTTAEAPPFMTPSTAPPGKVRQGEGRPSGAPCHHRDQRRRGQPE